MFIRIYIKHGNCGEHFLKTITDQILVYLIETLSTIYIYIYIYIYINRQSKWYINT